MCAYGLGLIIFPNLRLKCSRIMLIILMYFNQIENELYVLNRLKYSIFIPQFTTNELRNSNDQSFLKRHVAQEELSLIMHSFMCMCVYTHPYKKWHNNPLLFTSLLVQARGQTDDSCSGLDISILKTIWQVVLISRMLQFQYRVGFKHFQWMLDLVFLPTFISKLFNKVVFDKLFITYSSSIFNLLVLQMVFSLC